MNELILYLVVGLAVAIFGSLLINYLANRKSR